VAAKASPNGAGSESTPPKGGKSSRQPSAECASRAS
jgi:hypothetical protein